VQCACVSSWDQRTDEGAASRRGWLVQVENVIALRLKTRFGCRVGVSAIGVQCSVRMDSERCERVWRLHTIESECGE